MKITPTQIADVLLIKPRVFGDDRGFFYESFNQKAFVEATDINLPFVQDNHSKSSRGVLRGLHYQLAPHAQGKLVSVVQGEVFDVAVDIRKDSKTFGQWVAVHLSAENKQQLLISPSFAHGFLVLSETAEFVYKTTDYYEPEAERSLRWNDPTLGIESPIHGEPILAGKDRQAHLFNEL